MTIKVISALSLKEDDKKKIERVFSAKHTQKVCFEYSLDESIIGGILVVDGNNYYDGSLVRRLKKLEQTL